MPLVSFVAVLAVGGGCSGDAERTTLTVYFKRDLASAGPPGQVAPVLAPAEREIASERPSAARVLTELQQGPTEEEVETGFIPTFPGSRTHVADVGVRRGTAVVDLAGEPLQDFYADAALVYSLTELPGIARVVLRLNGQLCCVYDHQGQVISPVTRLLYRGWQGEPCHLRMYPDAVKCRGS
jgi:spore germination protein GerM